MWLLVGLALWWCLTPVRAWGVSTSASAAVLMDADTGQVLYDHNGSRRMLIASTTKIMTALVVLERASPGEEVTVRQEHMTEGSSMYLKPGERVTVEELLYGLLLCSGNDAAAALADYCGGTASFVRRMNGLARELGMEDTSFANPSGLDDDGHYSTARDMARLAVYAAGNHTFARLCSTRSVTIGGRTMTNHNRLLRAVPGCIGMKTGYTRAAGRTLVSGDDACRRMQGLALKNVELTALNGKNKVQFRDFGELLFTHFGVSGPLVLSASAHLRHWDREQYRLSIDLKPALDREKLEARILRDLGENPNRDFEKILAGLVPHSMVPVILERLEIPAGLKANSVTKAQRRALEEMLKGFTVSVTGPRPVAEAIVTSGGVKVNQVQPSTMESKLTPGLYFAGEILDVDAYTGGFNLQIAWSTGHLAGTSASVAEGE